MIERALSGGMIGFFFSIIIFNNANLNPTLVSYFNGVRESSGYAHSVLLLVLICAYNFAFLLIGFKIIKLRDDDKFNNKIINNAYLIKWILCFLNSFVPNLLLIHMFNSLSYFACLTAIILVSSVTDAIFDNLFDDLVNDLKPQ